MVAKDDKVLIKPERVAKYVFGPKQMANLVNLSNKTRILSDCSGLYITLPNNEMSQT